TADGKSIQRPIIPKAYRLPKAPPLKLDGKLGGWPAAARLPQWMLGCSIGEPQANIYLAWAKEGLYGAVEVHDSQLITADPRSFWNGDCLEIFVDTSDDKRHREYQVGDHQFWFVPLVNENRVYAGRWKNKNEIPATQYDIPGLKSAAVRAGDGYVMEFLLPAAELQKYRPETGARLGLSVNLTVKGKRFAREVYWPWTKADWALANWPKMWGSLELVE
ncbi:MAG: sugar-binding protein, partial [Planctomycetota bacterium]